MPSRKPVRRRRRRRDDVAAPPALSPHATDAARAAADCRPPAPGLSPNATWPESVDEVLAAFDSMSRSITDLARELNCLGHFDDPNSDLPRAA